MSIIFPAKIREMKKYESRDVCDCFCEIVCDCCDDWCHGDDYNYDQMAECLCNTLRVK